MMVIFYTLRELISGSVMDSFSRGVTHSEPPARFIRLILWDGAVPAVLVSGSDFKSPK